MNKHSCENCDNCAIQAIQKYFDQPRFDGIKRHYTAEEIYRARPTVTRVDYSFATRLAEKLWKLLNNEPYIATLGAYDGLQAIQYVLGGLKAIYLSGWQVAAAANTSHKMYPDLSLYPVDSVPTVLRKINNALRLQDQVQHQEGVKNTIDWLVPTIADAEAGFGGDLNTYELTCAMIENAAAGIHYEDQLASAKKCGHMGGKVVIPTGEFIKKLQSAREAADVLGVPTVIVARTDADSAKILANDIDHRDRPFIIGSRTEEGFVGFKGGVEACIARGIAYAPYADVLWMETSHPDLAQAKAFAEGVHKEFPGKLLAYNCSPSFNWKKHLDDTTISKFQRELGAMGYKFQFITLAGFHLVAFGAFDLAEAYSHEGMDAYVRLQQKEFEAEKRGYTATKHQREVGTGYYDYLQLLIRRDAKTAALEDSTEKEQF